MKKVSLILSAVLMTAIMMVVSCNKKEGCTNPQASNYDANAEKDDGSCILPEPTDVMLTDQDGNTYATIVIGTQEWMAENLRTTTYANGDPIPNVTDNAQWQNLTTGAWSHYNNDSQYENPYGKLYNWYAVADPRNICPTGWHVPSDPELTVLSDYLGGESIAGSKMKSTGTQYWLSPNEEATNESGFSGLPGGLRAGIFEEVGLQGRWWSSTQLGANSAFFRELSYGSGYAFRNDYGKKVGLSVRCLRD
jgi:uncharacterized protein (TIGR02145 family)